MDVLYLAWKYLAYHRWKTTILILSITLIIYLPIGLSRLVNLSGDQLAARAKATPLLVGAKGSPLELALSSLYFESDVPPPMHYAELERIEGWGLARTFPLHTSFRTRHGPIVGTSLEYFEFRGLKLAQGRQIGMLGECVLGARAARLASLEPGESVMSASDNVFDLAGVYPLKMSVVGILEATGTADDLAVFVDIKTAWVIQGLAHGHEDLERPEAQTGVLRRDGDRIIANASVMQYNEITPANVAAFHFHGDPAEFPISSVIAVPHDDRSSTLLQGRYLQDDQPVQIVRPAQVIDELLQTILTVQRYILIGIAILGLSTLATIALVFMLSLQLRRREMETMIKIGASRWRVTSVVAAEVCGVLVAGILLTVILTMATSLFASAATRLLVQMS